MNYDEERNNYIYNYLINDKTNSAILLNGTWGIGKTYYINSSLIPFLKNRNKGLVYVSLYGIKNKEELSHSIFVESKFKFLNSKAGVIGKGIGKTILLGLTSYLGINLDGGSKEWNEIKNIIDLNEKLLIIDDIERHEKTFDILEIMGYVNNLCEHDNVKVLLICDENIILDEETNNNILNYKKIKEKTISDSITFIPDIENILDSILDEYNFIFLKKTSIDIKQEIKNIIYGNKNLNWNFRAITRASQKMFELDLKYKNINIVDTKLIDDFLTSVMIGLIAFYLKRSNDSSISYDSKYSLLSLELGTKNFPLYKFAYEYCINQNIDEIEYVESYNKYCKSINLTFSNDNLRIIKSFYDEDENILKDALKNFSFSIKENNIEYTSYLEIATYLIAIKNEVNFTGKVNKTIDDILNQMIENYSSSKDFKEPKYMFDSYSGYALESDLEKEEMKIFISKMKNGKKNYDENDYQKNLATYNLTAILDDARNNKNDCMVSKKGFNYYINFDKLFDYISLDKCTAKDLHEIRGMFFDFYRGISNIKEYCYNDLGPLIKFKDGIDKLKKIVTIDKVKALQLNWFSENLSEFIEKLKKEGE